MLLLIQKKNDNKYVLLFDGDVTQSADNEPVYITSITPSNVIGKYRSLNIIASTSDSDVTDTTIVLPLPSADKYDSTKSYAAHSMVGGGMWNNTWYLLKLNAFLGTSSLGVNYVINGYTNRRLMHIIVYGIK